MTFQQLGIITPILNALITKGYSNPTPVQEATIPAVLTGSDVLASAQTGTGKTASFCIPILQKLSQQTDARGIRALVLTPTRELALQVAENLRLYGRNLTIKSVLVIGGVSQSEQVNRIRKGCDVVVATPGRLMDLIQQGEISLSQVRTLVLDEVDRMLDMGFIRDVKRILSMVPATSQKVFLSATMPAEIQSLVTAMLKNPVRIRIALESSVTRIEQGLYYVTRENKRALLKHVISEREMRSVLVFARTKHGADKIARDLSRSGISAEAIHGNKSQGARQRALTNFKKNTTRVLVATDIAARGIDISNLPFVINYEMPDTIETYTHRIGRTGRAGAAGTALSFCDNDEKSQIGKLNKLAQGKLKVFTHPFQRQMSGKVGL